MHAKPCNKKNVQERAAEAAAAVLLDTRYRERGGVGCCHLLLLLPLLPCRPRWRQVSYPKTQTKYETRLDNGNNKTQQPG